MSIKPVKGLRSYYPSDKGPVDTYQLGRNGRVEYLAAEIAVDHLRKGNDTTEEWKKWAKEKGTSADEVGLILSSRLGGSGTDKINLFPKSPLLDKTIWKEHEQAAVDEAEEMKKWKKIKFSARLEYPSEDSTRPSVLEYQYDLPSGTILYGKVKNELVPDQQNEDGEEEEEEVEEEEEEEEAEEEAEEEEEPEETKEASVNKVESKENESSGPVPEEEVEPAPFKPQIPIIETIPPTPRPSIQPEKSPSPPPSPPAPKPEPVKISEPVKTYEPPAAVAETNDKSKRQQSPTKDKPDKNKTAEQQDKGVITKTDLIELIPVIGSCKLAVDTVKAALDGNGRLALRKAVQCGISLVADFYLGRAIARHGKILANSVTEQTIIRFVSKAENQIIIVSTFKATNQLLNTLTRAIS